MYEPSFLRNSTVIVTNFANRRQCPTLNQTQVPLRQTVSTQEPTGIEGGSFYIWIQGGFNILSYVFNSRQLSVIS
jgi:hypothetical protein